MALLEPSGEYFGSNDDVDNDDDNNDYNNDEYDMFMDIDMADRKRKSPPKQNSQLENAKGVGDFFSIRENAQSVLDMAFKTELHTSDEEERPAVVQKIASDESL